MKQKILLLALAMSSIVSALAQMPMRIAVTAQPMNQKKDTLWGAYCYREIDEQISGVTRQERAFDPQFLKAGEKMVYYVLSEKCSSSLCLYLHTEKKARPLLSVKVTEVNTGKTITNKQIKTTFKGGQSKAYVMQTATLPSKSWYRIELTAQDWFAINSIDYFVFEHDSQTRIKPSPIFMAPSVHLNGWESTDPSAPKGESYDWAYMEVMLPQKYERKNTYVMSLGVLSGYMGMQTIDDEGTRNYRHRVLFSMWDKGNTDEDNNLPQYLRSGALDHEEGVEITRFGGEGTGTRSMIYDSHWKCDNWVQFICTCRPEKINITVKDSKGQDSLIEYTNTLVSAWYKEAQESEWHYLSTLREAGRNHYMSGWYSFLENFTDDGGEFYRRAYYRNGYLHSLKDNRWYNRNKVGFGHTQGNPQHPRYDYGHGATSNFENCFYLEQGGYSLLENDSAQIVPLATDNTPVDTINLQALWSRMAKAIRQEQTREMDILITQAAESPQKLEAFKSLAKKYLDNANRFGYYSAADLADLKAVFNNGDTQDAAGLALRLRELAQFSEPLKAGKPIKTEHLGLQHAYQIQLANEGTLCAQSSGIAYAQDEIATDASRNWKFVRQENSNRFIIQNLGTKLYFDPESETMLNSEPKEITVEAAADSFILSRNKSKVSCTLIDNYWATSAD